MTTTQIDVIWNGDGTYSPICGPCGWAGKVREVHSDATAALRAHTRSERHTRRVGIAIDPADISRIRDALRFYTERVTWSTADRKPGGERDQFNRLLERANRDVRNAPRGTPGCTCGTGPFAPPEASDDCPYHG